MDIYLVLLIAIPSACLVVGLIYNWKKIKDEDAISEMQQDLIQFEVNRTAQFQADYGSAVLIPCKACGGQAIYSHDDFGMPCDIVSCPTCDIEIWNCKDPQGVIDRWNSGDQKGQEKHDARRGAMQHSMFSAFN